MDRESRDQSKLWHAILEHAKAVDEAKLDELVSQGVNLDVINGNLGVLHMLAIEGNANGTELLVRKGANIELKSRNTRFTALHLAAQHDHAGVVQKLIELGANMHANSYRRPLNWTPFKLAVRNGSEETVKHFLIKPADLLNLVDADHGETPLHWAVIHQSIPEKIINQLFSFLSTSSSIAGEVASSLQLQSFVNKANHDGETPLHYAAVAYKGGKIKDAINLLLDAGAQINVSAHALKGCATPLHYAAGAGNLEIAQLLLDKGAHKNACDSFGATAFHYAARCGNDNVLKSLFDDVEVDVNVPASENGYRALHYAARNERQEVVEWLLNKKKASVNVTDTLKDGDTPLHLAARRGHAQVIHTLIRAGADVLLTNKKGELALGLADDNGHHEAAEAFVKAINEQNIIQAGKPKDCLWTNHSNGASLLHYFAAYGTKEGMEWILKMIKRKASKFSQYILQENDIVHAVNALDNMNRNAVHWAAMKGNIHVLRVLAKNGADLNADMNAMKGNINVLRVLAKNGADMNADLNADMNVNKGEDQFPKTPLYLALHNGKKGFGDELMKLKSECVTLPAHEDWLKHIGRWIMDSYSDEDSHPIKKKLESLKHEFEEKHHVLCGNLLDEIPPIFLALYAEREDIAKFIQQHRKGEDDAVNERGNRSGRTSLHWATLMGQKKIVVQLCRTLFKDNLTANVEDRLCKKTAVQYAKEMGTQNMEIGKEIEKELMQRSDVGEHIDGLYKDRQVYVDAANAMLVGAALIAGVTFAGWLQPPLGLVDYYNLPELSTGIDASTAVLFQTYAAIQQHAGVRCFWVTNGLSFSFAIATVLAGLVAVVPIPGVYIATSVEHLRQYLPIVAVLLGISIMFVLVAFAAAGFAVLPPLFKYQAIMLAITMVGAFPCVLLFIKFWGRLALLSPNPKLWLTDKMKKMGNIVPATTSRLHHGLAAGLGCCRQLTDKMKKMGDIIPATTSRLRHGLAAGLCCCTGISVGRVAHDVDDVASGPSTGVVCVPSSSTGVVCVASLSDMTYVVCHVANDDIHGEGSMSNNDDDAYQIGKDYENYPWEDGMSVGA